MAPESTNNERPTHRDLLAAESQDQRRSELPPNNNQTVEEMTAIANQDTQIALDAPPSRPASEKDKKTSIQPYSQQSFSWAELGIDPREYYRRNVEGTYSEKPDKSEKNDETQRKITQREIPIVVATDPETLAMEKELLQRRSRISNLRTSSQHSNPEHKSSDSDLSTQREIPKKKGMIK